MRLAIGLILIACAVTGFSWAAIYFPARFSSIWEFLLDNQFITGIALAYVGYLIDLLRRADSAARQLETLRSYIYFAIQDRLNKELRLRENLWRLLFHDEKVQKFVSRYIDNILRPIEAEQHQGKDDKSEIAKLVGEATPKIAEHLETFQIAWDGGLASEEFVFALADVSAHERRLVIQYINKYAEYSYRTKLAIKKSENIIDKVASSFDAEATAEATYDLLRNLFLLRQTSAELSVDGIEIIRALTIRESKLRQLDPARPDDFVDTSGDGNINPVIEEKFEDLRVPMKFKDKWRSFIMFSN